MKTNRFKPKPLKRRWNPPSHLVSNENTAKTADRTAGRSGLEVMRVASIDHCTTHCHCYISQRGFGLRGEEGGAVVLLERRQSKNFRKRKLSC